MAPAAPTENTNGRLVVTAAVVVAAAAVVGGAYYYTMITRSKAKNQVDGAEESTGGKGAAPYVKQMFIFPIKGCRGIPVSKAIIGPTGFLWDRQWMVVDEKGRFISQRTEPKMALIETEIPEAILQGSCGRVEASTSVMTLRAPGMDPLEVPLLLSPDAPLVPAQVWEWSGQAVDVGPAVATWLSTYFGRPAKLVKFDTERALRPTDEAYAKGFATAFSDGYPFLFISQASLDSLNNRLGEAPLDINRFRPNILVDGCGEFAEDRWKTFRVGSGWGRIFRGVKPCGRCKVTTTCQETAAVGSEPLETLKTFRAGPELGLPKEFKCEVIFGMNVVCEMKPFVLLRPSTVVSVGDKITVVEDAPPVSAPPPAA
eukprot:TRINITY_DN16926_c0_g1_i1.p1 TRINITY_DN16926_c0_g1~~TRINITY_DN16926_c0_g1_i1.p1  ORF type:complete len:371 (+),score=50.60 TRINITY_DN16926_c0_g1_i1:189-1301(+)